MPAQHHQRLLVAGAEGHDFPKPRACAGEQPATLAWQSHCFGLTPSELFRRKGREMRDARASLACDMTRPFGGVSTAQSDPLRDPELQPELSCFEPQRGGCVPKGVRELNNARFLLKRGGLEAR